MSSPRVRRAVVVLALLFLVVHAQAGRRRSVRAGMGSGTNPPPQGDCVTFDFVRPGLKATYLTTAPGGNVNFTITWISDTLTQTKTTQQVTTAQGSADVETLIDGEVVGNLRGMKHMNLKTSTAVPVVGKLTTEADLTFVPSLIAGPKDGWCEGATWDIPAVTETLVVRAPFVTPVTTVTTTVASQGTVEAVGETITVPAGTFQTVRYRNYLVTDSGVSPAITWTSIDDSIVVRQDTLDGSGNVTTTTQLTALQ